MNKLTFILGYLSWILLSGGMLALITSEALKVIFSDNPFWYMPIAAPIIMLIVCWIFNNFIKEMIYKKLVIKQHKNIKWR